jgi:hypothetical protein
MPVQFWLIPYLYKVVNTTLIMAYLEPMYGYTFIHYPIFFILALLTMIVWSIIWKGFALWKAARRNQSTWFVIMLVANTLGILEILYLFVFSKDDYVSDKKRRVRKK